jgi:phage terminase large subunit-like protein
LTLEDGSALELHSFQRQMLADFFGGCTETLILVPKKNGKSTLLSALALYHLVVTPDAECVIAAASRDQAQIMLRQARGFIRRSEALQRLMEVKQREITSLVDEGRIRVMASDVDTADGVIPTLALVDELHRHKSADLYGVFRDGLGPRRGRMITISTAGDDVDSPLGLMRASAYRLPVFEHEGTYR